MRSAAAGGHRPIEHHLRAAMQRDPRRDRRRRAPPTPPRRWPASRLQAATPADAACRRRRSRRGRRRCAARAPTAPRVRDPSSTPGSTCECRSIIARRPAGAQGAAATSASPPGSASAWRQQRQRDQRVGGEQVERRGATGAGRHRLVEGALRRPRRGARPRSPRSRGGEESARPVLGARRARRSVCAANHAASRGDHSASPFAPGSRETLRSPPVRRSASPERSAGKCRPAATPAAVSRGHQLDEAGWRPCRHATRSSVTANGQGRRRRRD